jgi:hypothetical protein
MATAAAALIMTAGTASAQNLMKAEVPFAFSVGNKVVEPGTYRIGFVSRMTSNVVLRVDNVDTKSTHMMLPQASSGPSAKWLAGGTPRLAFDCSTGACVLKQVWFGDGPAYQLGSPKTRGGEMRLTEILMTPDNGN